MSAGPPCDDEMRVLRDENVKHLEMIQGIVTRLAGNSFLIKGWCLTLAAAAFGLAVNRVDWILTTIGLFAVCFFWVLDSYFLRQERLFRHLYNHVRRNWDRHPRFSMNLAPYVKFRTSGRVRIFFSVTLVVFYGSLLVIGVLIAVLAHHYRPN